MVVCVCVLITTMSSEEPVTSSVHLACWGEGGLIYVWLWPCLARGYTYKPQHGQRTEIVATLVLRFVKAQTVLVRWGPEI